MTVSKILVTGADGFIGSHLTETLIKAGYNVRAFVYYNSFNSWGWLDSAPEDIKSNLDVFAGDIRDTDAVRQAMEGCDVVMHLAALIAIPYSYYAPSSYIETNVHGTLNILQAARFHHVNRLVCTSTSEVYGSALSVPISEEHPLQPQSPYSASKISADSIAASFYHSFGLPVTILRPFNTYGPRQSARAVIPSIISQIANNHDEISLGALHPTRDFTYVEDTAQGFIQAMLCDDIIGEMTNIGSNYEISIKELVELISDIMGANIKVKQEEERLRPEGSEVNRLLADTEKASRLMNWNPVHGGKDGLRKGLEKTVNWFTNSENLKLYKTTQYNV